MIQAAHTDLDVSQVVLLLQTNHAHIINPLGTTEFPKLGHPNPPLSPLPQMVIDLSPSNLIASELLQVLGKLLKSQRIESSLHKVLGLS